MCLRSVALAIYVDIKAIFFFFKQKTAYEMRISDWSSDVCSSDLPHRRAVGIGAQLDVAEGLYRRQLPVDDDRRGGALAVGVGRRAHAAGRDQHVLPADGGIDLGRAEVEAHQLVGVDPDAHGARRGEQLELPHARSEKHTSELQSPK